MSVKAADIPLVMVILIFCRILGSAGQIWINQKQRAVRLFVLLPCSRATYPTGLLFTTVISTQTLLASKADTITTKTAKLLAMQVIPVVGSTVGESLRTAGASIEYLRSNVGVALIVILILAILPTIITISIYRFVFIAGNAVSGLLGCNREGTLILEISSIFGYVLAILCISSIVVIYLLTIFAKCSSALV